MVIQDNMEHLLWLIPLFPLLGFLVTGFGFRRLPFRYSGWLASGMVLISFLLSIIVLINLLSTERAITCVIGDWINTGDLHLSVELLADPLSSLMILIITGIGFLIHIYSIGYMNGDEGYNRFFAYMNLFVFFMLVLVLGGSYMIMFIGWEGVGLCSYLLIGFWNKNFEFNNAARKAFVMNRIGDLGFLLGIFLIFTTFGSLSYGSVFPRATLMSPGTGVITIITILLFTGATGKSAQIPLLTWLPDAMAGPTPVSALIHAATMVTAGIYMVARSNILYALSPVTMNIIAAVAVATAILTAVIALFQNDIKKVLAYSTISQLGLMFLGLASGSFAGAMFHLMTHAFFKALLFLAAGSIIHALSGEQDIRFMGGLKKKIPWTYLVFLIGALSISGIPPFSGFFSKDEILAASFSKSPFLWIMGVMVSVMTASYIFRLVWLVFHGEYRGKNSGSEKIHEAPRVMLIPLVILALLSALGALPFATRFPDSGSLATFLDPVFNTGEKILHNGSHESGNHGLLLAFFTLFLILIAVLFTYRRFVSAGHIPPPDKAARSPFSRIAANKFYIDELYSIIIGKPLYRLSGFLHDIVDNRIFDRIVESAGRMVMFAGSRIRLLQTGNVGFYLFAMVICIMFVLLLNMLR
jgi:NADH-quinone oxidoreductase subunit L